MAHHRAARVRGPRPQEVVRRERRELWAAAPSTGRHALLAAVHPVLAAGFTHGDGTTMEVKDTERLLWRFWHTGRELGYLDERERSVDAPVSLSTTGRAAALAALRLLAEASHDHI